jgi:hypothetical protein
MIYTENVNVLQLNQHLGGKNLPIKNDKILRIYIYMYVTYIILLKMKYFCYRISTSIICMCLYISALEPVKQTT